MSSPLHRTAPTIFGNSLGPGERFAVLVVDFQRGFTDAGRPLGSELDLEVERTCSLLEVARATRTPIFFSAVAYARDGSDVGLWAIKAPSIADFVVGSSDAELDPRLGRQPHEPLIVKQVASACFGTSLVVDLQRLLVDSVIVVGTSTSGCVRATAVDLFQNGVRPFVVADAVGDRDAKAHDAALRDLEAKYADVIDSATAAEYMTLRATPSLGSVS